MTCERCVVRVTQVTQSNKVLDCCIQREAFSFCCREKPTVWVHTGVTESLNVVKQELYWVGAV